MFEKIFKGLERAHGCTKVTTPAENGVKLKGQSFVVRQPVTTELWKMHLDGTQSLGIIPINENNQCVDLIVMLSVLLRDCFSILLS